MGETRNLYRIVSRKSLGNCPIVRPGRRWENNIKRGEISGSHGGEYEDDVSEVRTASIIRAMIVAKLPPGNTA
jgi:hypothetical protein